MYKPMVDEQTQRELHDRIKLKAKSKKYTILTNGEGLPHTARNSSGHTRFNSIHQGSAKSLSMTPGNSRLDNQKYSISKMSHPHGNEL